MTWFSDSLSWIVNGLITRVWLCRARSEGLSLAPSIINDHSRSMTPMLSGRRTAGLVLGTACCVVVATAAGCAVVSGATTREAVAGCLRIVRCGVVTRVLTEAFATAEGARGGEGDTAGGFCAT